MNAIVIFNLPNKDKWENKKERDASLQQDQSMNCTHFKWVYLLLRTYLVFMNEPLNQELIIYSIYKGVFFSFVIAVEVQKYSSNIEMKQLSVH